MHIYEPCGASAHGDAHVFVDLRGVGFLIHGFADLAQVLHHRAEVERRGLIDEAITAGMAYLVRYVGAFEQRLAGHAARPRTVAAHAMALHQQRLRAEAGTDARSRQPRRR